MLKNNKKLTKNSEKTSKIGIFLIKFLFFLTNTFFLTILNAYFVETI